MGVYIPFRLELRNQIYCNLILPNSKLLRHTATHPPTVRHRSSPISFQLLAGDSGIEGVAHSLIFYVQALVPPPTSTHPIPRLFYAKLSCWCCWVRLPLLLRRFPSTNSKIRLFIYQMQLAKISIPSNLYPPARCMNLFRISNPPTIYVRSRNPAIQLIQWMGYGRRNICSTLIQVINFPVSSPG